MTIRLVARAAPWGNVPRVDINYDRAYAAPHELISMGFKADGTAQAEAVLPSAYAGGLPGISIGLRGAGFCRRTGPSVLS